MAIFKCKMCGGDLEIIGNSTVLKCEYCGTRQTAPSDDNEKKLNLFNRANRLRINGEFDKAAGIYENIVSEFPEEAEAYWGLVICHYGIEYVDDPATAKKIPTCHRASFSCVFDDENYKLALEYADVYAQKIYRDEAKEIDRIREDILSLCKNEPPYDIFICYKESDAGKKRTVDSVIAQDAYDALTEKGYRVFFARISLEDKLGMQYEPYIFAALNSAKIMLCFGTKYEYFHAVWVKNEWSRFLKLMAKDKTKVLIPCYKDMDAYDMPDEFKALQAQDMGKIGAIQDLIRGIDKILPKKSKSLPIANVTTDSSPIIKHIYTLLNDGDFAGANDYCDEVLATNPKCGSAYLAKLLCEHRLKSIEELKSLKLPLKNSKYFLKALLYCDENELALLAEAEKAVEDNFDLALADGTSVVTGESFFCQNCQLRHRFPTFFKSLPQDDEGYVAFFCTGCGQKLSFHHSILEDAGVYGISKRQRQIEKARAAKIAKEKEKIKKEKYDLAVEKISKANSLKDYAEIIDTLSHTPGYLNSDELLAECRQKRKKYIPLAHKATVDRISVGRTFVIGLKNNGSLLASGTNYYGESNVKGWQTVISVSTGFRHTLGLKRSGRVLATGDNSYKQLNVDKWENIVAVAAGDYHSVALKKDGTLVATGNNLMGQCNIDGWYDISSIAAGSNHTVGLKYDGTLIATGDNSKGQCDVSGWSDVVWVCADSMHTVALKKDGSLLATGNNSDGQCDVAAWNDIIGIATGAYFTVGLKADSTVVITGKEASKLYDLSDWENIVDIAVGDFNIFGLKCDGTVISVGDPKQGRYYVGNWRLFEDIDALIAEYEALQKRLNRSSEKSRLLELRENGRQKISLQQEKLRLENELSLLGGLFNGKEKAEIEAELRQINALLAQLSKSNL